MTLDELVSGVGVGIDVLGVAAIVAGVTVASFGAVMGLRRGEIDVYSRFRRSLGRSILLGLELLVAADIVRTVASSPTLNDVAVLAVIVGIRTFLSLSLDVEIRGRLPWERSAPGESR